MMKTSGQADCFAKRQGFKSVLPVLAAFFTAQALFVPVQASSADILVSSIRLENVTLVEFTRIIRNEYRVNSVLEGSSAELAGLERINLVLKNVPLWIVAKYAAREAGVRYQFRDGMLFLGKNLKLIEPYYPEEHKLKHSVLDKYPDGTRIAIEESSYHPIGYRPGKTIVVGNAVFTMPPMPVFRKFHSGFWYDSIPEQQPTQDEIEAYNRAKRHPYVIPENFPLTTAKLHEIMVDVDFNETPLHEALEVLRELAVKHDPAGQGVNFYLEKAVAGQDIIFDMKLTQTSLHRIINFMCLASGLAFRVAPCVVEIYQPE